MTSSLTLLHGDYTVGWICALPSEMAAARAMLDEHHNPLQQNSRDHNTYTLGRIGRHNVVLACLPTGVIGTLSAARVANQMLQTFERIRFGLMVGIGGGVPSEENDIRLGDVVVSKPTGQSGGMIQYDFGKTVQEGRFKRTGSLSRPPDVLLTALANLQSKHMMEGDELAKHLSAMLRRYPRMASQFARPGTQHDLLYDANYDHTITYATCSQCDTGRLINREPRHFEDPFIHYGLIASGDQVMRHGATRERLGKELDVLCFEMEAAGLMDDFPCLVVRGICDYADSHKNKRWQGYAAATAAAYAKELLCVIPPRGAAILSPATAVVQVPSEYTRNLLTFKDHEDFVEAGEDDDEVASVRSMNSPGSTATGSSATLVGEVLAAANEFVSLLLEDQTLTPLLSTAFDRIKADRLERNIKRLLKVYAIDLRQEASGDIEKEAVQLILIRARYIAYRVRQCYDKSAPDETGRFERLIDQSPEKRALLEDYLRGRTRQGIETSLPEPDVDGDDDGGASDSNPSSEAEADQPELNDLDRVKVFMVESAAYQRFRQNLRNFVLPRREPERQDSTSANSASFFSLDTWRRLQMKGVEAIHGLRMLSRPLMPPGHERITWICVGRMLRVTENCTNSFFPLGLWRSQIC
jgi:nucleoside phosphorylase